MTRTKAEALAYLTSRPPSTIRLGLERMASALERLGHPQRSYPILQVAGTNGKGSTCAFASEALKAHGLLVGRYTSPHLEQINERFWVGGQDIADEMLGQRTAQVLERLQESADELTYFELGTLVAVWHFAQERVDAAVLEVGLGGRLDATTATTPQVTAVASIGLDHTELLGETLEKVAAEKAGVFKPGVPALASAQTPEVVSVLEARAREVGAPLFLEGRDFRAEPSGTGFRFRSLGLEVSVPRLSLRGLHQHHNAALALAAVERLAQGRWVLEPNSLAAALGQTVWPARLEEVVANPPVVVDGAHNPAGVEALLQALEGLYPRARIHLVFGVLAEKDAARMRSRLFLRAASVHLTPLPSPRSASAESSLPDAKAAGVEARSYATPADALDGALSAARARGGIVLCAGSLVLAGAARAWAQARR
jgi:dihydrofolate synthase/folylpolyglutamate synthase